MMTLCSDVLSALTGRTLATAESCTGGGIGALITAVPGASKVYKGGVISYTNEIKARCLGIDPTVLEHYGAVSEPVAAAMATGARKLLEADVAISVTGLAGPGGDEFGNPVGTVYIGYADENRTVVKHFCFEGDREAVRRQAIRGALELIMEASQ